MKRLLKYGKGYGRQAVLAPLFKMLEASFELFVPLVVAAVIDTGIRQQDIGYILRMSGLLVLLAVIGLTCCPGSEIDRIADVGIAPAPGPEVITGSTRMKSGTAQKMVLNMLSTGTMIKLGKVYGNLMVDVKPSNEKLVRRCVTIVCEATGVGEDEAVAALEKCGYVCKQAIVMLLRGVDAPRAAEMLNAAGGRVAAALEEK